VARTDEQKRTEKENINLKEVANKSFESLNEKFL
jgi:hypothetical protein